MCSIGEEILSLGVPFLTSNFIHHGSLKLSAHIWKICLILTSALWWCLLHTKGASHLTPDITVFDCHVCGLKAVSNERVMISKIPQIINWLFWLLFCLWRGWNFLAYTNCQALLLCQTRGWIDILTLQKLHKGIFSPMGNLQIKFRRNCLNIWYSGYRSCKSFPCSFKNCTKLKIIGCDQQIFICLNL